MELDYISYFNSYPRAFQVWYNQEVYDEESDTCYPYAASIGAGTYLAPFDVKTKGSLWHTHYNQGAIPACAEYTVEFSDLYQGDRIREIFIINDNGTMKLVIEIGLDNGCKSSFYFTFNGYIGTKAVCRIRPHCLQSLITCNTCYTCRPF
jgi:hypothetical protein